ncbi:hypothetical protein H633G_10655 [Metarhizium anisopliae BRIP 53284]|nr:hypothetical protein H633G_10655 [Metarhizium anisopliae BRIP 53284]
MKFAWRVLRWWDIDSIRFGGNTLAAIRAPNDFRITFLPRYGLTMSTNQVVQPHGLTMAKIRHVLLGYVQAGRVRFSVFVFFPSSASTTDSKTSASSNTLSHERLKELYDEILLPALRESIRGPFCQEVPQSFDMIYAKSRSFQEKPGMGQWSADDESRPCQLAYTLPATGLSQFWSSFEEKANLFKIRTKRGKLVAYFRNPRLVFQAHDLKNSLIGTSVDDVLSQFDKTVLSAFNPDHLDMRSCWVDVGVRYCAEGPSGEQRAFSEPATFLWKSRCNRHAHEKLAKLSPESPLSATHYRSFLLRDAGNMVSKTTTTKTHNAGHPDCRQLGTILAKTYSCNKELFGVMFSHYGFYNSPHLALMALTQDMIQDLDSMTKDRERVFTTRRCRESISRAWEANRRHVEAISDSRSGIDYGARKEVTFCLGTPRNCEQGGKSQTSQMSR